MISAFLKLAFSNGGFLADSAIAGAAPLLRTPFRSDLGEGSAGAAELIMASSSEDASAETVCARREAEGRERTGADLGEGESASTVMLMERCLRSSMALCGGNIGANIDGCLV